MNLGIIVENGNPVAHRSLLKIFLNPILRIFGRQIASLVEGTEFHGYRWEKCPRKLCPKFALTFRTNGTVIRTHRFF